MYSFNNSPLPPLPALPVVFQIPSLSCFAHPPPPPPPAPDTSTFKVVTPEGTVKV